MDRVRRPKLLLYFPRQKESFYANVPVSKNVSSWNVRVSRLVIRVGFTNKSWNIFILLILTPFIVWTLSSCSSTCRCRNCQNRDEFEHIRKMKRQKLALNKSTRYRRKKRHSAHLANGKEIICQCSSGECAVLKCCCFAVGNWCSPKCKC